MYVNNVVIVGNVTGEPRRNGGGEAGAVSFRVSVNRWRLPGAQGADDGATRTDFIDVEVWGSQAENVFESLGRGDRVIVAGQLRYDQWEEDGELKTRVKIKALAVGPSLEFQSIP